MELTLNFTVEQLNVILNALGQRPFVETADLIGKIKIEAEQQLAKMPPVETPEPTED